MADPRFIAQVVLHRKSALAKDDCVNVMHFEGDDVAEDDDRERWDTLAPGLATRIRTFYETVMSNFGASYLGPTGEIRLYDHSDAEPRVPRYVHPIDLSVVGPTALPAEVALCVSYRGAASSGANMRRRRGRIYLGPFSATSTQGTTDTADGRPHPTMVSMILNAFDTMATGTSGAARLCVYSPTTDLTEDIGDAYTDVTNFYIDNAWDTQRRRGATATLRSAGTI